MKGENRHVFHNENAKSCKIFPLFKFVFQRLGFSRFISCLTQCHVFSAHLTEQNFIMHSKFIKIKPIDFPEGCDKKFYISIHAYAFNL